MQPNHSACVALTAKAIIFRCQKVEIAWTLLSTFQQRPAITTGLDSLATQHEMYANAQHSQRLIVSANMNVYPDVNPSESEGARAFGDSNFILIQIGRIYIKYLSITNKMGKFI